jgi:hypothetical protein
MPPLRDLHAPSGSSRTPRITEASTEPERRNARAAERTHALALGAKTRPGTVVQVCELDRAITDCGGRGMVRHAPRRPSRARRADSFTGWVVSLSEHLERMTASVNETSRDNLRSGRHRLRRHQPAPVRPPPLLRLTPDPRRPQHCRGRPPGRTLPEDGLDTYANVFEEFALEDRLPAEEQIRRARSAEEVPVSYLDESAGTPPTRIPCKPAMGGTGLEPVTPCL